LKYRFVYTHRAIKDIQRLEPAVKKRIGKTLLRYEGDPLKYAIRLTESKLGTYRSSLLCGSIFKHLTDSKAQAAGNSNYFNRGRVMFVQFVNNVPLFPLSLRCPRDY